MKLYLVKYITYEESKHKRLYNGILNLLRSYVKRNDKLTSLNINNNEEVEMY